MKMLNVAMMEEWAIINGDSTSGAGLQFGRAGPGKEAFAQHQAGRPEEHALERVAPAHGARHAMGGHGSALELSAGRGTPWS